MYQYLTSGYNNISYLLGYVLNLEKFDIKGFLLFIKKNRGMGSGNLFKRLEALSQAQPGNAQRMFGLSVPCSPFPFLTNCFNIQAGFLYFKLI